MWRDQFPTGFTQNMLCLYSQINYSPECVRHALQVFTYLVSSKSSISKSAMMALKIGDFMNVKSQIDLANAESLLSKLTSKDTSLV